jgi:tryptophan synthase alpha chain
VSRIDSTFAALKSSGRMAFMPFITAADPDVETTAELIQTLAGQGVDLIEVGFPYSDPIADGPVIQASYTRALNKKATVAQIFAALGKLDAAKLPPLVAMLSYAIIFRHGPKAFIDDAKRAGFSGFIIPDLPGDEAADIFAIIREAGLDLVQLVAPTTPPERVRQIVKNSSGFVYCIAVAGTTGVREQVADQLLKQLDWLKTETKLPLAVGFGIGKPEHIDPLRGKADGVIVGSAVVKHLQDLADGKVTKEAALTSIGTLAKAMADKAHCG